MGRRAFLFARSIEPSGTYMVLGGLYERREAPAKGEKRFETDPKGVLLREQESKCELLGPAREVFEYPVERRQRGDIARARARCRRSIRHSVW